MYNFELTDKNKERLIELIREAKTIRLMIAKSSRRDAVEDIYEGDLNEFVLFEDGCLELCCNTDYEI